MEPIAPLLQTKAAGTRPIIFAKDQPEYIPLVAEVTPEGMVVTRWRLNEEERVQLLAGVDVYVCLLTFNRPLQPILVTVGPPLLDSPGG